MFSSNCSTKKNNIYFTTGPIAKLKNQMKTTGNSLESRANEEMNLVDTNSHHFRNALIYDVTSHSFAVVVAFHLCLQTSWSLG